MGFTLALHRKKEPGFRSLCKASYQTETHVSSFTHQLNLAVLARVVVSVVAQFTQRLCNSQPTTLKYKCVCATGN